MRILYLLVEIGTKSVILLCEKCQSTTVPLSGPRLLGSDKRSRLEELVRNCVYKINDWVASTIWIKLQKDAGMRESYAIACIAMHWATALVLFLVTKSAAAWIYTQTRKYSNSQR